MSDAPSDRPPRPTPPSTFSNPEEHAGLGHKSDTPRDLDEREEAEAHLRVQAERLRMATEAGRLGMWDYDLRTGAVRCDRRWCEIVGVDPDTFNGSREGFEKYIHPDDREQIQREQEAAVAAGQDLHQNMRIITPAGEVRWITTAGRLIYGADGTLQRIAGIIIDVTEHKAKEEHIRMLNERLQLAIQAGGIGIWELDVATNRLIWNQEMFMMYGIAPETFRGDLAQWIAAVHPDDVRDVLTAWEEALNKTSTFSSEFRVIRPSGEIRHIRCLARVYRNSDGSPQFSVGANWDVTVEREMADSLGKARDAANIAERAKSNFLATMSHEIRTPLNTVLGMTQLALLTELTPKQHNYLSKIDTSARVLIGIITDILDFSKIEAGRFELDEAAFTLSSVLESVSSVTTMKAEEKGLKLTVTVAPDVPNHMLGDSLRLGQVLINLVTNAVKFTKQGEIAVSVTLGDRRNITRTGPDLIALHVSVRDTGIGLTPDQMDKLFQPFSQAERNIAGMYGGTGLGLAISKQIVEMMGGRIGVTSQANIGSTFSFTIAVKVPQNLPDSAQTPAESGTPALDLTPLAGRRVLVVDDNEFNREVVTEFLQLANMSIDTAVTGADAIDHLQRAEYDMVLMDMRMPVMDGMTATREIRRQARWAELPIIALTAQAQTTDRAESLAAGMNAHVTKPIDEKALYETLLRFAGKPRQ